jgi:glycosyltransferase involved in cell wall biosynthesis
MLRFAAEPSQGHFLFPYQARLDVPYLETPSAEEARAWCEPGDTLLVDWANPLAQNLSRLQKDFQLVVRVHDHEIFKGKINAVDWEGVDGIWVINPEFREAFLTRFPEQADKLFYLPNAVLPEQFVECRQDAKRIGFLVLDIKGRKRLDRALNIFRLLHTLDPEWELVVRTKLDNDRKRRRKFRKLRGLLRGLPVRFDAGTGKAPHIQDKSDISAFFEDMAVVLNTSEHEGFCYAVAEGALCGCLPVVWSWESGGAEQFWDPFVVQNRFQAIKAIMNYEPSPSYRQYVVDNFSADVLAPRLMSKLDEVLLA